MEVWSETRRAISTEPQRKEALPAMEPYSRQPQPAPQLCCTASQGILTEQIPTAVWSSTRRAISTAPPSSEALPTMAQYSRQPRPAPQLFCITSLGTRTVHGLMAVWSGTRRATCIAPHRKAAAPTWGRFSRQPQPAPQLCFTTSLETLTAQVLTMTDWSETRRAISTAPQHKAAAPTWERYSRQPQPAPQLCCTASLGLLTDQVHTEVWSSTHRATSTAPPSSEALPTMAQYSRQPQPAPQLCF